MRKSRPHVSLVVFMLAAFCAGAGCTTIDRRFGDPIPVERAVFEEGATDIRQVAGSLGPPHYISALPGGLVVIYEYVDASEQQLGFNLDFIGVNWLKMSFGHADARRRALLFFFDDDGLLVTQKSRNWMEDLGRGFGFQLFFIAAPTVDTRFLDTSPGQLNWGRAALKPLPVALNAGQSLLSGRNGIELRGTPESIGQHTLEMRTTDR